MVIFMLFRIHILCFMQKCTQLAFLKWDFDEMMCEFVSVRRSHKKTCDLAGVSCLEKQMVPLSLSFPSRWITAP